MEEINLPPKQQQMVALLIAGRSVTSIAEELKIDRTTVYEWRALETCQAEYNRLAADIKAEIECGIVSLYGKAIKALHDCLESDNDKIKYEAALHLLNQSRNWTPGPTDPKELVRQKATTVSSPLDEVDFGFTEQFDHELYKKRLKELGLQKS